MDSNLLRSVEIEEIKGREREQRRKRERVRGVEKARE